MRVVCEIETTRWESSSSSAFTRLDLPAPLGAATANRFPGYSIVRRSPLAGVGPGEAADRSLAAGRAYPNPLLARLWLHCAHVRATRRLGAIAMEERDLRALIEDV